MKGGGSADPGGGWGGISFGSPPPDRRAVGLYLASVSMCLAAGAHRGSRIAGRIIGSRGALRRNSSNQYLLAEWIER
jgi:hypothetical protein